MADTGLGQFLDWGTGTDISYAVGKVTGGSLGPYESALAHREGIGAQDDIVGGPVVMQGDFTVTLQSEALLAYALRSSYTAPTLTALSFAGGNSGDGRKQTGCYINTLGLTCSVGESLTANIGWMGLTDAVYTTEQKSYLTDYTWNWFKGTATIGGATLECQSFDISVSNNIEPIYSLDAKTTNQMRWPDSLKIGSQELSVTVDCLETQYATIFPALVQDDLAQNNAITFTFVGGTSGTDTMTIALTNLARVSASAPWTVGGGLVSYTYGFEAKKDCACLSISVAAA